MACHKKYINIFVLWSVFLLLSFKSLANRRVRSASTDFSLIPTRQKRARNGRSKYVLRAIWGAWINHSQEPALLNAVLQTRAHTQNDTHTQKHTEHWFVQLQCSFSRVLFFWPCSQVTGAFKAPAVLPHCGCMTNFSTTSLGKSLFFSFLWCPFAEKIETDKKQKWQFCY